MPGRPGPLDRPAGDSGPAHFALGAVILAGGRATRLGGTDKPALAVGGQSLVAAVAAAAAAAGARQVVLVGPRRPELLPSLPDSESAGAEPGVRPEAEPGPVPCPRAAVTVEFTREQPPGAGPVPALAAGLRLARTRQVLLLAADLPFLRPWHLRDLAAAAAASGGAVLADDGGRPQWLTSCWQTAPLRAALAAYPGRSLGGLLGPLDPVLVSLVSPGDGPAGPPPWLDCDTPEDLAAARRLARSPGRPDHRKGSDEHA
jgi:molybdopterin-guanine dinucleotide biosynthesis protein A